jgi:hypothetical protein
MSFENKGIFFFVILFISSYSPQGSTFNKTPCGGPTDLLNIIDRPTVGDSACVVPDRSAVLEMGYQYQKLLYEGTLQNLPEALLRVGLADSFEFNIFLPNYIHQTVLPHTGFTATNIGIKHELAASKSWVTAIEGYITFPSGSASFGSQGTGWIVNGLFTYTLSAEISLAGMLGLSSQTQSIDGGGLRYSSFNPDLVLSWNRNKMSIYGELYGESNTGPQNGSGFMIDTGILYQIKKI